MHGHRRRHASARAMGTSALFYHRPAARGAARRGRAQASHRGARRGSSRSARPSSASTATTRGGRSNSTTTTSSRSRARTRGSRRCRAQARAQSSPRRASGRSPSSSASSMIARASAATSSASFITRRCRTRPSRTASRSPSGGRSKDGSSRCSRASPFSRSSGSTSEYLLHSFARWAFGRGETHTADGNCHGLGGRDRVDLAARAAATAGVHDVVWPAGVDGLARVRGVGAATGRHQPRARPSTFRAT